MALLLIATAACGGGGTLRTEGRTFYAPTPTPTATPSPSATPTPEASPSTGAITIAFVGDVMMQREVEQAMAEISVGHPLERALPLFEGADLVVANMEMAITDVGVPLDKTYQFALAPRLVGGLTPFWAVSLANNHATDYGLVGLNRTLDVLDQAGIAWFGAGRSEAEARGGIVGRHEDTPSIGYLGYNDIGDVVPAQGTLGGVATASVEAITEDVRRMRAGNVDFVVVTLHAGTEYSHEVTEHQRELAHAAIDAGADLVVGHHPHVLQEVEQYEGGLILYSLGNFVFDLDADDLETLGEGPFQSVVALVTFEAGQPPRLELRPARIDVDENRPRPATDEEAAAILALLGWPPEEAPEESE